MKYVFTKQCHTRKLSPLAQKPSLIQSLGHSFYNTGATVIQGNKLWKRDREKKKKFEAYLRSPAHQTQAGGLTLVPTKSGGGGEERRGG